MQCRAAIVKLCMVVVLGVVMWPGADAWAQGARMYYVSRRGSGGDGRTWATAWSELNRINWSVVRPGDTIEIDGGGTACAYPTLVGSTNEPKSASGGACGMVYESALTVGRSGNDYSPVTIRLSDEVGRNGTVRIFGGRAVPLPYCGQTGYNASAARTYGIKISSQSHIVVDGRHWAGILVYGTGDVGVWLYDTGTQHDVTFRNLEVYDNGKAGPNGNGVQSIGANIVFERMLVHDNGQDAFKICRSIPTDNMIIRDSWLFNQRSHPTVANEPWNYCSHSDGVQYCSNTTSQGLVVESSIIGPGFMQGLILGEYKTPPGIMNNVLIRDTLIVDHHGASNNTGLYVKNTGWDSLQFDHVTVVRDANASSHSIYLEGPGSFDVRNSLFVGGTKISLRSGVQPTYSNNYRYKTSDVVGIARDVGDPRFKDSSYAGVGSGFADFDFTVQNTAIPSGVGSSIVSAAQLLGAALPNPTGPHAGDTVRVYLPVVTRR